MIGQRCVQADRLHSLKHQVPHWTCDGFSYVFLRTCCETFSLKRTMSDNILVAVRVRPLITREEAESATLHWQIGHEHTITQVDGSNKPVCAPYQFDKVLGIDYDNEGVYTEVAEPIVEAALDGFNGTIFAYGQTSSGKTFTMMGDKSLPGIIPLAIQNIFRGIENTPDREYLIRASYMEIYNESITDLLVGRESRKLLHVREDQSGNVYVADLKEECVNCEKNLLELMRRGDKNRHIGTTNMNERSSRSHTIFRLILESRERSEGDGSEGAITVSHLNLVDLAGSENASQSGATGERLKEGGYINRSLFMLGRVISQLSEGEQFINFRDSKLTRILQLSLGGNAKTAIICTVTPATVDQTHSTLRFASRAKSIKNKPVVNEVLSEAALLKRYAKEIKRLKESLDKERNTDKAQEVEQVREMLDEQARRNQELTAKVNELKTKLVVSSHPRDCSKNGFDKRKKARRETWAAPPVYRATRASMCRINVEPMKVEDTFLHPEIPPWVENSKHAESIFSDSSSSVMDCSTSDGFGKGETSFAMDLAEQSKLGKLDASFDSPRRIISKRRKRVQFELGPPLSTSYCNVECQTEESLLSNISFFPSFPLTPKSGPKSAENLGSSSTPVHILRTRNEELQLKLEKQQEWLMDWQREIKELREFQKHEIQLLQESFSAKVHVESVDHAMLEEQRKEIMSLKHSLRDLEALLLDANRTVSQRSQEVLLLQEQIDNVNAENLRSSSFESELLKLRDEHKQLKKATENKDSRLKQLENERHDFDVMMELALKKKELKESDLRKSLDEAWNEIAKYKGSSEETVMKSGQRVSVLEEERERRYAFSQQAEETEQKMSRLQQQLEEAHCMQETTEQKLQQMTAVIEKMREIELEASRAETLACSLTNAQDELKTLKTENLKLKDTANKLQMQLDRKELEGGSSQILILQEEVQYLQDKLEEAVGGRGLTALHLPHTNVAKGDTTVSSLEISRKLSETLQALEESMVVPCSQSGELVSCLDEPILSSLEVNAIKQQLIGLQNLFMAQENSYLHHQQELYDLCEKTSYEYLYYPEMIAEFEEEISVWKLQESFCGDYIIHSWIPDHCKYHQLVVVQASEVLKCNSPIDMAPAILDDERVKYECEAGVMSLADELHEAGMDMTLCSKPFETSFSNTELDVYKQEVKKLKHQLQLVTSENRALLEQVKDHQESVKLNVDPLNPHDENESIYVTPQQTIKLPSLADEFHQAGESLTLLNETLEASIHNLTGDADHQEIHQLEKQSDHLHGDSSLLQNNTKQMHVNLEQMKQTVCTTQQCETLKDQDQSVPDKSHNESDLLGKELASIKEDKIVLECEIENLKKINSTLLEQLHFAKVHSVNKEMAEDEVILKEKESFCLNDLGKIIVSQGNIKQDIAFVEEKDGGGENSCKLKEQRVVDTTEDEALYQTEEMAKMQQKLRESDNVIASLQSEREKCINTLDDLQDKLPRKTKELDEARETVASSKSNVDPLKHLIKEFDNAQITIASLKEQQNNEIKIAVMEDKSIQTAGELSDTRKVNTHMEIQADVNFLAFKHSEQLKTDCKQEQLLSESMQEKEKELEKAKCQLKILQQEKEQQLHDFEKRVANVIADKDNELEIMITNFMDKEEAFENRERELQKILVETENVKMMLHSKDLEIQNMSKVCEDLQNRVKDLELDLIIKGEEHLSVKENYSKLEKDYEMLKIFWDNKILELKNGKARHEEQLKSKTHDMETLSTSCKEKQKLLSDAREKEHLRDTTHENELHKSADHVLRRIDTNALAEVSKQAIIDKKLDELEHLKDENALKTKECDHMRNTIDNLKIMVSKKDDSIKLMSSSHDKELSSYSETLNKKNEVIYDLENMVRMKGEEAISLRSALEAKDHKLKRLECDLKAVQQILDSNERNYQEFISGNEIQISSKIQELNDDIKHLTKLYEEVCDDRKNMAEVINVHKEEAQKLTRECSDLKLKLIKLEDFHESTIKDLKTKDAEIVEKQDTIYLLKLEHQKLQEDIAILQSRERDLSDQESSNQEQLVGLTEKYETEISEKDEQICKLKTEVEYKTTKIRDLEDSLKIFKKVNEEVAQNCKNMEEMQTKCMNLEEELLKCKRKTSELRNLPDKLLAAENELEVIQASLSAKIKDYEELGLKFASEKQELGMKLLQTEEKYKNVKEDLVKVEIQLQEKTELVNKGIIEHDILKTELENIKAELGDTKLSLVCTETVLDDKILCLKAENEKLQLELSTFKSQEKEMNAQIDSNSEEIEKLIRHIEKYETEMSEKDEQLQRQTIKYEAEYIEKEEQVHRLLLLVETKSCKITELEATIKSLSKEITQKCFEMEELKKYASLKEEISKKKEDSSEIDIVPNNLDTTKGLMVNLQDALESTIGKQSEEIVHHVFEIEKMNVKLLETERELCCCQERLRNVENDLEEKCAALNAKQEECSELGNKMDSMVIHYNKEKAFQVEMFDELQQKCKLLETELSETELRYVEVVQSYKSSVNQVNMNKILEEKKELQSSIVSLKEELSNTNKELAKKERLCMELNAEMDDIVDHYKMKANKNVFDTLATQKSENVELRQQIQRYKENVDNLVQSKAVLQEKLKISTDTVGSLIERLGEKDKLSPVYQEKDALENKLAENKSEMEAVIQSASNENVAFKKTDILMQKVKMLEDELETARISFKDLAEKHDDMKKEYTALHNECKELRACMAKKEILLEQNKDNEKLREANTLMSCSSSDTSGLNLSKRSKKSKTFDLEMERDNLRELYIQLANKNEILESTIDSLRRSQGAVSTVEEFQRELTWMREKMEASEKQRDLLSSNYDILEKDFEALRKEVECLRENKKQLDAITKVEETEQYQRKFNEVKEEKFVSRSATTEQGSTLGEETDHLKEKIADVERMNNELRFRLRALNAPAEKEVQTLREELNLANKKVTHLKQELRRIQNSNLMDSTVCHMKAITSHHGDTGGTQGETVPEYDYSSGSGIVCEVQVLYLQNKIYHLEKAKKSVESECNTLTQHLEHYKTKAQEWKNSAVMEKMGGEKTKKELEQLCTENNQLKNKVEEMHSHIERLQFDLGHKREILDKLEKEKQELSQKLQTNTFTSTLGSLNQNKQPSTEMEAAGCINKGASNVGKTVGFRSTRLSTLNAPLPTQTSVERLPFIHTSEAPKNSVGKPVWQSRNKENKDYSKYYTASGASKKSDDDCKTQ